MSPGGAGILGSQFFTMDLASPAPRSLSQLFPDHSWNPLRLMMWPVQSTALQNLLGMFRGENHLILVGLNLKQEAFTGRNGQLGARKRRAVKSLVLVQLKHSVQNAAGQKCNCMFQEEEDSMKSSRKAQP